MSNKKQCIQLGEWLEISRTSQAEFAQESGLPQSAVSRLVNGGNVKTDYWAKVMRATYGAVRPEAYCPEPIEEA